MLVISGCTCDGNWELVGIFDICGGGGSGGNNGGTQGGNNGGYTPGEGGGGGGGTGGSPTQPNIPNIPSEDVVHVKRYRSFLTIQLTQQEVDLLITSQNLSDHIFEYLCAEENNFSPASINNAKWFMNFYSQTIIVDPTFDPFIYFNAGTKFIAENTDIVNPNNVFLRIYALEKFLVQNPNGLFDISCYEIQKWEAVANHPIPQSVKNRINTINSQAGFFQSASLQSVYNGGGPSLNMDVFAVTITDMPNKQNGQKYTPAEFFDYFRKNFSSTFIDNNFSTFTPVVNSSYGINDTALWNSNNPLGALIHIHIPILDPTYNDGTVITSGFGSQAWIFTTVDVPWDGQHPVSGNRLFGYFLDPNGDMTIYIRGVDRFTFNWLNYSATWVTENIGFANADDRWESFQTKMNNFVNSPVNGGISFIVPPTKYRPNWVKIRGYLKGTEPITSLGCH